MKSAQSAISAIFLAHSSYLMMRHAKDVRPASLALSGSEGPRLMLRYKTCNMSVQAGATANAKLYKLVHEVVSVARICSLHLEINQSDSGWPWQEILVSHSLACCIFTIVQSS